VGLLPPLTRDQVSSDLHALWDDCEATLPAFRNLWATMAHSPIVFRHVWGQLLELKRRSSVAARYFEIAIVVVSNLNRCAYCVSHHAPLAEAAGLRPEQLDAIANLTLGALPEDHDFPTRLGFARAESRVIDLAHFIVWSGVYPHVTPVHPRVVHALRRRLFGALAEHFSRQQIEELTWRTTQCVAFNWHNEFLELDVEPELGGVGIAPGRMPSPRAATPATGGS
jgi:AhpD family alkylhydroperoxidase